MKRIKKQHLAGFAAAALVMVLAAGILMATGEKMKTFMGLRTEIHDYAKKEIIPDLKLWKSDLDKAMSSEDLATLNKLRAKATEMRKEMREKMKEHMAEMHESDHGKKDMRKEMKDMNKGEMKELAEQVKPLARKYKSTLDAIAAKAKPEIENWKKDIKAVVDNWKKEHESELKEMDGKGKFKMHEKMMGRMLGLGDDMNKDRIAIRFMLWDGSDDFMMQDMGSVESRMKMNTMDKASDKSFGAKSSPNPFNDKTSISFTNPEAQRVTITISDSKGNLLKTLFDGEMAKGDNSIVFAPTQDMPSGTYMYKISAGKEVKTGKLIYNK